MPARRLLQRFLPFFRQFFLAWAVCCLRLQPFLTERLQHWAGVSPLLQLSPWMTKHWPVVVLQKPPGQSALLVHRTPVPPPPPPAPCSTQALPMQTNGA